MKKRSLVFLFSLIMIICQFQCAFAHETLPSGVPVNKVHEKVDSIMNKHIGKDVCGASLVVIDDGKVIFEKGYGYSDKENKISVDPHKTVFEYGSISKLFVWTSAMKLAEEGKLDLDQDIRTYLPKDFKMNTKYDKPVTMKMLMNHMGGFGDYGLGLMGHKEDITDLRTALESAGEKQVYEPGTVFSYSNYGTALAGYVIQCIEGKDFYEYVDENIFTPLNMITISSEPLINDNPKIKENKAKCYYYKEDGIFEEGNASIIKMYPAGSMNGTIDDLSKFALELIKEDDSRLFKNKNTAEEMFEPTYSRAENIPNVCHGFIYYDGEKPAYWHDGETECFQGYFMVMPKEKAGIILLYNSTGDDCSIQDEIAELLDGKIDKSLDKSDSNLPDVSMVEGDYITPRRSYSGITQLMYFPGGADVMVKKLNSNEIDINGEKYTQIKPYIFENNASKRKIVFKVENDKVVKMSGVVDSIPITMTESIRPLFTLVSLGFGLIMSVIVLLKMVSGYIRRKIKNESLREEDKKIRRVNGALFIGNMIFVGNIAVAVLRFVCDMRIQFSSLRIHFILEAVFALMMIYLIYKNMKMFKISSIYRFSKIICLLFIISSIMIVITFAWWGTFNFVS